jgi:glucose-6-phosphate dehydrogenase assembly protein OpcA
MTSIDVDQLLDELAQQRRTGISTTSLNIVAFVEGDAELLARVNERIDTLAERNVSRTLLLACEEREHSVRSHYNEVNETLVTHSEQIQLAVLGLSAQQLRSIVHDLLVPNVRTVLLWGGGELHDPRFVALAELADIVILFSSVRNQGAAPLREILTLRGTGIEHKLRDLAFLRLLPWQDMIAQFFDDADLAAELPHITRLEVVTGSAPEAYYFVGWLASRLAWDACGRHEFCNIDGGTITISMRQQGPPRRIAGVRLTSAHSVFGATIQEGAEELICLTVEGEKSRPQRCVPLHDVDMITLIENAIFMPRSEIYSETLSMVERLLEHES